MYRYVEFWLPAILLYISPFSVTPIIHSDMYSSTLKSIPFLVQKPFIFLSALKLGIAFPFATYQRKRENKAKLRLRATSDRIKEITDSLGFGNASYYICTLRETTGMASKNTEGNTKIYNDQYRLWWILHLCIFIAEEVYFPFMILGTQYTASSADIITALRKIKTALEYATNRD